MSVIVSVNGNPQGAIGTVSGTGTTAKIFQAAKSGLVVSGVQDYVLPLPGTNRLNGKQITVLACGQVYVHGTSPTFQLQLLGSVAGSSNTVLAQTAATSLTTNASYDWNLEVKLFGSTAPAATGGAGGSGSLVGQFASNIGGTYAVFATLTNPLTSVVFGPVLSATGPGTTNEPIAYLKLAAVFGVSDAANLAAVTEWAVSDYSGITS